MTADAVREALELIGQYWDLAYAEGKEGRTTDTPNGDAQRTLAAIEAKLGDMSRLAALAGAAQDADELSRLYELAGYGGVSADAPERIILASSMYDGLECCDKWCSVDRVVDDGQPMPESATVYIRADLSHAPAKAREDDALRSLLRGCAVVLDRLRTDRDKQYLFALSRDGSLIEVAETIAEIDAALATFAEGAE